MPSIAETLASLSSVPVSPEVSAASLRAPMRGEILPINVTTTARVYDVPAFWKNRIVNVFADGADVFIQISTGIDAMVDETVAAVETLVPNTTRYALSPSPSANGCWRIAAGTWQPIAFGKDASTFALKGTASGKLRTHVAET